MPTAYAPNNNLNTVISSDPIPSVSRGTLVYSGLHTRPTRISTSVGGTHLIVAIVNEWTGLSDDDGILAHIVHGSGSLSYPGGFNGWFYLKLQ